MICFSLHKKRLKNAPISILILDFGISKKRILLIGIDSFLANWNPLFIVTFPHMIFLFATKAFRFKIGFIFILTLALNGPMANKKGSLQKALVKPSILI